MGEPRPLAKQDRMRQPLKTAQVGWGGNKSSQLERVIHRAQGSPIAEEAIGCIAATRLPRGSDLQAIEIGDRHNDSARFDRESGKATIRIVRAVASASIRWNVAASTSTL